MMTYFCNDDFPLNASPVPSLSFSLIFNTATTDACIWVWCGSTVSILPMMYMHDAYGGAAP